MSSLFSSAPPLRFERGSESGPRAPRPPCGSSLLVVILILLTTAPARPQGSCGFEWAPNFGPRGTNQPIEAMAVHDDGSGPALYVAGSYIGAAGPVGVDGIARWDGLAWSAVGVGWAGMIATPRAMVTFDDGTGPALYVGGSFTPAGGGASFGLARWDGSAWTYFGALTISGGGSSSPISALTVFDDGSGPALMVTGAFSTVDGVTAFGVARWNGTSWTPLSLGLSPPFGTGLAVHDDGSGPALYVTGAFTTAGLFPVTGIARWDGVTWSAVGGGITSLHGSPASLAVHDDGSGLALYVTGKPAVAASSSWDGITRWDGTAWSVVGGPLGANSQARDLAVFDDGSGPALYLTGNLPGWGGSTHVARWDGAAWTGLGSGLSSPGSALAVFSDASGPALYCGGHFQRAGSGAARHFARWDGLDWQAVGSDQGLWQGAAGMIAFDDGTGPALWVGGASDYGPLPSLGVARWSGGAWLPADAGLDAPSYVGCFAVHDDGSGLALYAGGNLGISGAYHGVARWSGAAWQPLIGIPGHVAALAVHDDGSGPALYAGGNFQSGGGAGASLLARWTGSAWVPVGGALTGSVGGYPPGVDAISTYGDGSGPALYVGGIFTSAGGVPAGSIARWDGQSWSSVGGGVFGLFSQWVTELHVHDDGAGPRLFAGGFFQTAGTVPVNNAAAWDGAAWQALGLGLGTYSSNAGAVQAFTIWDDGSGAALYAGGSLTQAGGIPAQGLARWDGASWSPVNGLASGLSYTGSPGPPNVTCLASFDDGTGPALFAGGAIHWAGANPSLGIAKWSAARPYLSLTQTAGPGSGVIVGNLGLDLGTETFNVFSVTPCTSGVGSGPYLGLCAPNPADLITQVLLPLGVEPFHFLAPGSSAAFGPYPLPVGTTLEGICFTWSPLGLGCVSPVRRLTVQ